MPRRIRRLALPDLSYAGRAEFPPPTPVSLRRMRVPVLEASRKQKAPRSVNREAFTTAPSGQGHDGRSRKSA